MSRMIAAMSLAGTSLTTIAFPAAAQTISPASPQVPAAGADTSALTSADQNAVTPPAAQDEPTASPDIIVTATRRAESVQRVPLSVAVVSADQLRASDTTNVADLPRLVPALQFNFAGQSNLLNFAVRGVSTYAFLDGLEQTVGVNYDGVPVGRPGGSFADLVDVDRVEVLQGPQGLLFGKNASAGLVSIYTTRPKFEDSASIGIKYGSRNELEVQGTINAQIVPEKLALRASGWSFTRDGFIFRPTLGDYADDRNDKGARVSLRWTPDALWTIDLIGEYSRRDSNCCAYPGFNFTGATAYLTADAAQGIVQGFGNYTDGSYSQTYDRFKNQNLTLSIDRKIGNATITSITGYRRNESQSNYDILNANLPFTNPRFPYSGRYRQFTQEFRASGDVGRLGYVAGLFFYDLNIKSDQTLEVCLPVASPTCTLLGETGALNINSRSYAAFTELTYRVADAVKLIAGGRVSHDDISGNFGRTIPAGDVALLPPLVASNRTSYTNFSYRVGIEVTPAPDKLIYATYSTGYKGPGLGYVYNISAAAIAATGAIVRPETTRSFELGWKSQFFNRRVTFNVAGFYSIFSNFQTTIVLPTTPPTFAAVNANELQTKGFSADLTVRPLQGLRLSGNVIYAHSTFTDFKNAACYRGQTVAQGCVGGVYNVTGQSLTNAPRWTFNLSGRYDVETPIGGLFFQSNYAYKSTIFWQTGDPNTIQRPYGLTNGSIGVKLPGGKIEVSVYAKNLFAVHSFGRITPNAFGPGYVYVPSYETQRSFGIALNGNF